MEYERGMNEMWINYEQPFRTDTVNIPSHIVKPGQPEHAADITRSHQITPDQHRINTGSPTVIWEKTVRK